MGDRAPGAFGNGQAFGTKPVLDERGEKRIEATIANQGRGSDGKGHT